MLSENIMPYVQAANRKLQELGDEFYAIVPIAPDMAEYVAAFASQFEPTEYDPQEVATILSAPNASYAVVDKEGKLAHITLAYPCEAYNPIWGNLGKLEDYGGPFGEDLTDGRHFYGEAIVTAPEYQNRGLTRLVSSLVNIEARLHGFEEMIYLDSESAIPVREALGARRTDREKTMVWDGKDHEFYEMCKLLDDEAIGKAFQTIMTEEDMKQYMAQAQTIAQAKAQGRLQESAMVH